MTITGAYKRVRKALLFSGPARLTVVFIIAALLVGVLRHVLIQRGVLPQFVSGKCPGGVPPIGWTIDARPVCLPISPAPGMSSH